MNKLILAIIGNILLIGNVYAETAAPAQTNMASQLFLLGGFVVIFYFLMWRPQSKRAKAHRDLLANISQHDEVITSGGLVGRVTKISGDFLVLNLAEGVEVTIQKQAITCTLPKGTLKSV